MSKLSRRVARKHVTAYDMDEWRKSALEQSRPLLRACVEALETVGGKIIGGSPNGYEMNFSGGRNAYVTDEPASSTINRDEVLIGFRKGSSPMGSVTVTSPEEAMDAVNAWVSGGLDESNPTGQPQVYPRPTLPWADV